MHSDRQYEGLKPLLSGAPRRQHHTTEQSTLRPGTRYVDSNEHSYNVEASVDWQCARSCCNDASGRRKCELRSFSAAITAQIIVGVVFLALAQRMRGDYAGYMFLAASLPSQLYFAFVFAMRCTCPCLFRCCSISTEVLCLSSCVAPADQRRCCISQVRTDTISASERTLFDVTFQEPEGSIAGKRLRPVGMPAMLFPPGMLVLGLVSAGPLAGLLLVTANLGCLQSYTQLTLWSTQSRLYCPEAFWLTSYRSSVPVLVACLVLLLPLAAGTHLLISRIGTGSSDHPSVRAVSTSSKSQGGAITSNHETWVADSPFQRVSMPKANVDPTTGMSDDGTADRWLLAARDIFVQTVLQEEAEAALESSERSSRETKQTELTLGSINGRSRNEHKSPASCQSSCGTFACSMMCSQVWILLATAFVMAYPAAARAFFLYSRTCNGSICKENPFVGDFYFCVYCAIAIDKTGIGKMTVVEWCMCLVAALLILYLQLSVTGYLDDRKISPSRNKKLSEYVEVLGHPAHVKALAEYADELVRRHCQTTNGSEVYGEHGTGEMSESASDHRYSCSPGPAEAPSTQSWDHSSGIAGVTESRLAGIPVKPTLIKSFQLAVQSLRDTREAQLLGPDSDVSALVGSSREPLDSALDGSSASTTGRTKSKHSPNPNSSEFIRSTLAGKYYAVASLIAETDLADESVAITGFAIWTVLGILITLAILGITIYYGLQALLVFIIMQGEGSATTVIFTFIVVVGLRQGSIGLGSESTMTTKIGEIVERWPSLQVYWAAHDAAQKTGPTEDQGSDHRPTAAEGGHAALSEAARRTLPPPYSAEIERQSAVFIAPLFKEPLPTSALGRAFTVKICGFPFSMRAIRFVQNGAQLVALMASVVPLAFKLF